MAKNEPTFEERQEEQRDAMRKEHHALAHHASPAHAGYELQDGSDARKAKQANQKKATRNE